MNGPQPCRRGPRQQCRLRSYSGSRGPRQQHHTSSPRSRPCTKHSLHRRCLCLPSRRSSSGPPPCRSWPRQRCRRRSCRSRHCSRRRSMCRCLRRRRSTGPPSRTSWPRQRHRRRSRGSRHCSPHHHRRHSFRRQSGIRRRRPHLTIRCSLSGRHLCKHRSHRSLSGQQPCRRSRTPRSRWRSQSSRSCSRHRSRHRSLHRRCHLRHRSQNHWSRPHRCHSNRTWR